jgi:hypothetical protein
MGLPDLTEAGVVKFRGALDTRDLVEVVNSNATSAVKNQVKALITSLQEKLDSVIVSGRSRNDPAKLARWIKGIAPLSFELTELLDLALDLPASETGACRYQGGGCIVTTRLQCEDLGGVFDPGVDCAGNPL